MKAMALSLGALLIVIGTTGALAQQSPATSPSPPASDRSANPPAPPGGSVDIKGGNVDVKADVRTDTPSSDKPPASGDRRPDVNVNVEKKDQPVSADRNDGGSALPRSAASDRTTILGLSPAAAIVIAAALLVVVILAIVAMTRSGETTYIDRERRL